MQKNPNKDKVYILIVFLIIFPLVVGIFIQTDNISIIINSLTSLNISDWQTAMYWNYIQNKPLTFIPSIHNHTLSFSNITNFGTYINQALLTSSNVTFSRITLGSYYLDTLIANNKVSDSDRWDSYHFSDYINQAVKSISNVIFNKISATGVIKTTQTYTGYGSIGIEADAPWYYVRETDQSNNPVWDFGSGIGVFKIGYFTDILGRVDKFTLDLYGNGIFMGTLTTTKLIASGGIETKYMSGDYGLTWTQTMPTGTNGMIVIVYNSNVGILLSREYIYSNGAWHYIAII